MADARSFSLQGGGAGVRSVTGCSGGFCGTAKRWGVFLAVVVQEYSTAWNIGNISSELVPSWGWSDGAAVGMYRAGGFSLPPRSVSAVHGISFGHRRAGPFQ